MHVIIERLYLGLAKSVKASRTWNLKVISLGWASITSWTYSATFLSSFTESASRAFYLLARCCAGAFKARWAHGTRLNGELEGWSSTSITCKYVKPLEWKGLYIILHFEIFSFHLSLLISLWENVSTKLKTVGQGRLLDGWPSGVKNLPCTPWGVRLAKRSSTTPLTFMITVCGLSFSQSQSNFKGSLQIIWFPN